MDIDKQTNINDYDWDLLSKKYFPEHTCPASRHVKTIAVDILLKGHDPLEIYDAEHLASSLQAVVKDLWETRHNLQSAQNRVKELESVSGLGDKDNAPWTYDSRSQTISDKDGNYVAMIRGWGHLTGAGHTALGLTDKEAAEIQDERGRRIAKVPEYEAQLKAKQARIEELEGALTGRSFQRIDSLRVPEEPAPTTEGCTVHYDDNHPI